MESGIIIALISLTGTLILSLLQYKKDKVEGRKTESEAISSLVEVALKVSKQETDTLRNLCEDLTKENQTLKLENKELEKEVESLKIQLQNYI
jgi:cell division protein FtsB